MTDLRFRFNIIYKRITGESGYFDSRVVYISESGPKSTRKKRLAIVDQDGENHKFLTDGSYLALTPRFSPAAQEIAYLSYNNKIPRIFILDQVDQMKYQILILMV